MSSRRCSVCGLDGKSEAIHLINAEGIPQDGRLCQACKGGRSLWCYKHRIPYVVFIDNSAACPKCIEYAARAIFATAREKEHYDAIFRRLRAQIDPDDYALFLKLVRNSTVVDLDCLLAWLCAVCATAMRQRRAINSVIKQVEAEILETRSFVRTLLPCREI